MNIKNSLVCIVLVINFNHIYSSNAHQNPDIIVRSDGNNVVVDAATNYRGGSCQVSVGIVQGDLVFTLPKADRITEYLETTIGGHLTLGLGFHNVILNNTTVGGNVEFKDKARGVVILRNGSSIAGRVINGIQVIEANPVTETTPTCVQCVVQ